VQQRAEIERIKNAPQPRPQQHQTAPTHSSSDFANFRNDMIAEAKKAMADGDMDKVAECLGNAEKAETAARQAFEAEQQQRQNQQLEHLAAARQAEIAEVFEADKKNGGELSNPESPLRKTLANILSGPDPVDPRQPVIFERIPNGLKYAVEVAKLRLAAASVPELKEKVTQLEAELAEARKLTQLETGGPTSRVSPNGFNDDMNADEMFNALRTQAA
jgi:FtsZ-binding cell division protein ZapB